MPNYTDIKCSEFGAVAKAPNPNAPGTTVTLSATATADGPALTMTDTNFPPYKTITETMGAKAHVPGQVMSFEGDQLKGGMPTSPADDQKARQTATSMLESCAAEGKPVGNVDTKAHAVRHPSPRMGS